MIITHITNQQIIWTPGKTLAVPDPLSGKFSLKDLNGYQLAHKEFPMDIRLFNQNVHEFQSLIDHNRSADDANDIFYPIVSTHPGETKALHLKKDGNDMICTIFALKWPKVLSNVSDFFGQGKNNNNSSKSQASPMVVEAKVHGNFHSEIESNSEDSEDEVSVKDLVIYQDILNSPNKHAIMLYHPLVLYMTYKRL